MDDVQKICQLISTANMVNIESRKAHVETVKQDVKARDDKVKGDICPWCGATLIKRQGKYGSFKGCSTYPKCKFTFRG
ncbi:MAG: hypothetical protein GXY40_11240 [Syntrophomonadaceae bacterium]|nr:hypothetical protein [Syntrophomonadaceae bacterium]